MAIDAYTECRNEAHYAKLRYAECRSAILHWDTSTLPLIDFINNILMLAYDHGKINVFFCKILNMCCVN
jgi:hypothetical protein